MVLWNCLGVESKTLVYVTDDVYFEPQAGRYVSRFKLLDNKLTSLKIVFASSNYCVPTSSSIAKSGIGFL